jgi:hypothetical protein
VLPSGPIVTKFEGTVSQASSSRLLWFPSTAKDVYVPISDVLPVVHLMASSSADGTFRGHDATSRPSACLCRTLIHRGGPRGQRHSRYSSRASSRRYSSIQGRARAQSSRVLLDREWYSDVIQSVNDTAGNFPRYYHAAPSRGIPVDTIRGRCDPRGRAISSMARHRTLFLISSISPSVTGPSLVETSTSESGKPTLVQPYPLARFSTRHRSRTAHAAI